MPKAYWVSHIDVTDMDRFMRYAKLAMAAFEASGGKVIVRGGGTRPLEGSNRSRNVIVEFESLEAAERCYQSELYQQAKLHRDGAAEMDLVLLEALA